MAQGPKLAKLRQAPMLEMTFSTRKGDTHEKFLLFCFRFSLDDEEDWKGVALRVEYYVPLKGQIFFSHDVMLTAPPPWVNKGGSHQLWVFPASALTLVLARTQDHQGTVTTLNAKPKVTPSLDPLSETNHVAGTD
ncbi:hypothetical protein AVEN_61587-1 [Araneus ventricosus]|uniref:Uncharacterized protein n=1 Tax=Araneus ventricosus TaxID=182803 RepID=A0A4Y2NPT8_ARAVE|nr:hypothetical protein AVEN_61587-1 [Araneus ventricosus]